MRQLLAGEGWPQPTFVLLCAAFFFVASWELWKPRRELGFPLAPRWAGNFVLYAINGALLAWIFTSPPELEARHVAVAGIILPRWPEASGLLGLVLGFLFCDGLRYAIHRLLHTIPVLWRLHSLHHADSDLDVSTSFRHHPLEFLIVSAFFWLAFLLVSFPAEIATAYFVSASVLTCFQHGNIGIGRYWEEVLQRVIVTPDIHRLHHSTVPDEANSNYGFLFSFWDRLFGTYRHLPSTPADLQFGLAEVRNPNFLLMLALPFKLRPSAR